MARFEDSFDPPYDISMIGERGFVSQTWLWFFNSIFTRLKAMGIERYFSIENGQREPADVVGMSFNYRNVCQVTIDYMIKRVSNAPAGGYGSASDRVEAGILTLAYKRSGWTLDVVSENKPDNSGVTFSITPEGQVQYTSSAVRGRIQISSLFWRARTLSARQRG